MQIMVQICSALGCWLGPGWGPLPCVGCLLPRTGRVRERSGGTKFRGTNSFCAYVGEPVNRPTPVETKETLLLTDGRERWAMVGCWGRSALFLFSLVDPYLWIFSSRHRHNTESMTESRKTPRGATAALSAFACPCEQTSQKQIALYTLYLYSGYPSSI